MSPPVLPVCRFFPAQSKGENQEHEISVGPVVDGSVRARPTGQVDFSCSGFSVLYFESIRSSTAPHYSFSGRDPSQVKRTTRNRACKTKEATCTMEVSSLFYVPCSLSCWIWRTRRTDRHPGLYRTHDLIITITDQSVLSHIHPVLSLSSLFFPFFSFPLSFVSFLVFRPYPEPTYIAVSAIAPLVVLMTSPRRHIPSILMPWNCARNTHTIG